MVPWCSLSGTAGLSNLPIVRGRKKQNMKVIIFTGCYFSAATLSVFLFFHPLHNHINKAYDSNENKCGKNFPFFKAGKQPDNGSNTGKRNNQAAGGSECFFSGLLLLQS
jgi:hypothetical protein